MTSGNESVIVGNGQELPVTHIGNGKLLTSSHQFRLDNILRVPALASNLSINFAYKTMFIAILMPLSS